MNTYKRVGITIGAVVILAVALFAWTSGVFMPGSTSSPTSSPTGSSSAGVIDYTVTPARVIRDSAGKFMVEVEVVRKDASAWKWKSVAVENISITGQTKATAKLISALPTDPIPERFGLKFETDAIDSDGAKQQLHFALSIKVAKHLGLGGGSSQKSHHIPLEPSTTE